MKISVSTTKKGRINVHADGEYMFTVPAFVWYRSPLCGGDAADPEALDALHKEGQAYDAYEKALRLLAMRAHSEKELCDKLRRDYPAEAVARAAARLNEAALLDDAAYAESLAEELYRRRHYAPERIRMELIRHGVSAEIAKNTANGLDIDKKEGIIDIITKMRLPEHPTKKEADRLIRRLLNAGYSMREIREVVAFSDEDAFDA